MGLNNEQLQSLKKWARSEKGQVQGSMMDKETKSVQGTEGRSIRNKLEFSGRTVVSGMKKTGFRDGRGFDREYSQRLGSANDVN